MRLHYRGQDYEVPNQVEIVEGGKLNKYRGIDYPTRKPLGLNIVTLGKSLLKYRGVRY